MRTLLAAALFAVLTACADTGSRQAPELSLPDLGGRLVTLSESRGRVVLLNFWATWCDSCREEVPALAALNRRLAGKPFTLLSVSLDEDAAKAVPPFAQKHGVNYPVLAADGKTLGRWGVRGLPATFLIGPDGAVVKRWLGPIDASAVENDILALLDRRPS